MLQYRLAGVHSLRPRILPLRRLLALCNHRRFVSSLFPPDPRMERFADVLRVHDARADGASVKQIVDAFYGPGRAGQDGRSDSLTSRIRRLVREARAMAAGGYRSLMDRDMR
ncbi:DNA -binding domain-containing protein [Novosphingobium lindaniclasticum]